MFAIRRNERANPLVLRYEIVEQQTRHRVHITKVDNRLGKKIGFFEEVHAKLPVQPNAVTNGRGLHITLFHQTLSFVDKSNLHTCRFLVFEITTLRQYNDANVNLLRLENDFIIILVAVPKDQWTRINNVALRERF